MDRIGNVNDCDTRQDRFLMLLYTHRIGRMLLKLLVCPKISKLGGWLLQTKISKLWIPPFVRKNKIDLSLYLEQSFDSYNSFFIRKIKPEFRPIVEAEDVLISPCDGKLSIYSINERQHFWIKQTEYSLESLLRSRELARMFEGGYAYIFRLTVDDYHRYCYVDDGKKSDNTRIPGILHTVNPIANDVYPIYKENSREYCLLESTHFGTVLHMEVGALMVGRITNYHGETEVKKGQEKGRFEFGGSTVILLLQKDRILPDKDLQRNTAHGYETIVRQGERIGLKK